MKSRLTAALVTAAILATAFATCGRSAAQAPGDREGLRTGPRLKHGPEIHWRQWSRDAFAEAKQTKRLVLLDLTAVWCHWCHVMDETSYADSVVVRIVNADFVPIRVDSDRHPEIRDRYVAGGWPTTAILNADGHVLAAQTYVPAKQLRTMLTDVRDLYRKNRSDVDRKISEAIQHVKGTWKSEPVDSASLVQATELVDQTLAGLVDSEDKQHGGFGGEPRFHDSDAVTLLLRVAKERGDSTMRVSAIRAVDGLLRLQDAVAGGFYRYATKADWTGPHYEKMLWENARAIESCLEAYRVTGRRAYRDAADRADAYVGRTLWSERAGGYFGSQDADLGSNDRRVPFMAGEDYYILSPTARRRAGTPAVDSTFYADANSRMASAMIGGVLEGAWERLRADRALQALDRLWTKQRAPDGSLYHAMEGVPSRGRTTGAAGKAPSRALVPGLLADQALAGLAYLDAYELTGDARHVERARALADWIRDRLEDRVAGGFRYAPYDSTQIGRLLAGEKPPQSNVDAATLFLRLNWLEGRAQDRTSAERAFGWLRSGVLVMDPSRALLALRMKSTPVRFAVIGNARSGDARALADAAFRAEAPDKAIRYVTAGHDARWGEVRFPSNPSPALYVCSERACAPPIRDPRRASEEIRALLARGLP